MRFASRFILVGTALLICLGLAAPAAAGNLKIFGSYWDTSDAGAFTGAGARYTFSESLGLSLGVTGYFEGEEFDLGEYEVDSIDNMVADIGVHVSSVLQPDSESLCVGIEGKFTPALDHRPSMAKLSPEYTAGAETKETTRLLKTGLLHPT